MTETTGQAQPKQARKMAKSTLTRQRIIDAAHLVGGEVGVERITFRAISEASGVGLGSLTYHYADRLEIIGEAADFSRLRFLKRYRAALTNVGGPNDLACQLAQLVELLTNREHHQLLVDYNFFLTCLDHPKLKPISDKWTEETFALLTEYADPFLATLLSYQMEGMFLHSAKSGYRHSAAELLPMFQAIIRGCAKPDRT